MNAVPVIRFRAADVATKLAELDLTADQLRAAAEAGYRAAVNTTANDVPSMFGTLMWGKTFRGLADLLVIENWTYETNTSYPAVVDPAGRIAITVWNGDRFTGQPDKTPAPKQPKGVDTGEIVKLNAKTLFDAWYRDPKNIKASAQSPDVQTWVLLVYPDVDNDEVRVELSLPSAISAGGYIATWSERIILGSKRVAMQSLLGDIEQEATEAEVKIKRRAQ